MYETSTDPALEAEHAHRGTAGVRAPRLFRVVEVGSVMACIVLDLALARAVWTGLQETRPPFALALATVALAYLASDLVSGIVHFVGDSFGTVETPWLGRTFVLPFRSHHDRPWEICDHDFVETNGNNAFAALFALVPTLLFVDGGQSAAATLGQLFSLVFTVSVLLTNQIHKWAHVRRPPYLVRALQRAGLLLSPDRHRAHHEPPHGRGYCVTSGLCNALLDPIGFFPRLERAVRCLLPQGPKQS